MSDTPETLLLEEIVSRDNAIVFNPVVMDLQRQFIDDKSKRKSLLCGRRSGKSSCASVYLLEQARANPAHGELFIGLTRSSAKSVVWKDLKKFNKLYQLGMKFNNSELIATLPNDSEIRLVGGNDKDAVEAVRGTMGKVDLILVDEAQSYKSHLEYMLEEILTPMLVDADGTLGLLGTPAAHCSGPFFEATTDKKSIYKKYSWNILKNVFLPHAADWLERYRQEKKWTLDNPIYLREWMGQWIRSNENIVYKYSAEVNLLKELPKAKFSYLLGIDIGWGDATAMTLGAYRENDPTFYVIETFSKTNMVVDEIMEKVSSYYERYSPDRIVMDSGGGGKLVAESLRKRYSIPIRPAQKRDKRDFIEQMNSDFLSGRIQILPGNQELIDQAIMCQWDENGKKEDPRYPNDLLDSLLYTWRESLHYIEQPQAPAPDIKSDAWFAKEQERMYNQAQEMVQRQKDQEAEEEMYSSDDT